MRVPVLCLAFLSTAVLLPCSLPTTAAPRLVPVTGRVVDAQTGKPVAGALIGVYESGCKTVKTDSKGRFKVLGVPGSKRFVYYDGGNPLYRSDWSTFVRVNLPTKGLSGVTLKLWKARFAYGKVFMPSGMPLVGASVTIGGEYFTHAVTDSNGKFKIEAPQEQSKPGG